MRLDWPSNILNQWAGTGFCSYNAKPIFVMLGCKFQESSRVPADARERWLGAWRQPLQGAECFYSLNPVHQFTSRLIVVLISKLAWCLVYCSCSLYCNMPAYLMSHPTPLRCVTVTSLSHNRFIGPCNLILQGSSTYLENSLTSHPSICSWPRWHWRCWPTGAGRWRSARSPHPEHI